MKKMLLLSSGVVCFGILPLQEISGLNGPAQKNQVMNTRIRSLQRPAGSVPLQRVADRRLIEKPRPAPVMGFAGKPPAVAGSISPKVFSGNKVGNNLQPSLSYVGDYPLRGHTPVLDLAGSENMNPSGPNYHRPLAGGSSLGNCGAEPCAGPLVDWYKYVGGFAPDTSNHPATSRKSGAPLLESLCSHSNGSGRQELDKQTSTPESGTGIGLGWSGYDFGSGFAERGGPEASGHGRARPGAGADVWSGYDFGSGFGRGKRQERSGDGRTHPETDMDETNQVQVFGYGPAPYARPGRPAEAASGDKVLKRFENLRLGSIGEYHNRLGSDVNTGLRRNVDAVGYQQALNTTSASGNLSQRNILLSTFPAVDYTPQSLAQLTESAERISSALAMIRGELEDSITADLSPGQRVGYPPAETTTLHRTRTNLESTLHDYGHLHCLTLGIRLQSIHNWKFPPSSGSVTTYPQKRLLNKLYSLMDTCSSNVVFITSLLGANLTPPIATLQPVVSVIDELCNRYLDTCTQRAEVTIPGTMVQSKGSTSAISDARTPSRTHGTEKKN
jgi:hypothetical protein